MIKFLKIFFPGSGFFVIFLVFAQALVLQNFVLPHFVFAAELLKKHSSRPLQAEATRQAMEPWETPISGFFIRSHHGVPVVPEDPKESDSKWVLKIDGLVEKPLLFTLADLKKMPIKSLHAVLECSGNGRALQKPPVSGVQWERGAVGNAEWSGVKLSDLLAKAGVKSNAHYVRIEGADLPPFPTVPAFIRSVPLDKMLHEDTLLAWSMNREPMPILHGGPLRLILTGWYGENWIKWLTHLTLTETEDTGFFMKKGYRIPQKSVKPGEPWDSSTGAPIEQLLVQSYIVQPTDKQRFPLGQIQIDGKAFSGAGSISKVELSIDQGKTWQLADVISPRKSGGWQEFHKILLVNQPGPLTLLSRATDSQGNQQPMTENWNPGAYLRNSVDSVEIELVGGVAKSNKIIETKEASGLRPRLTDARTVSEVAQNPVLKSRCLTCHTKELIESQRLTPQQWEGVLKKMEAFGVKLEPPERQALLVSLNRLSPEVKAPVPSVTQYDTEIGLLQPKAGGFPSGVANRGKALFTLYCVACHGEDGAGKIGPRLRGRFIPRQEFWSTVTNGKGVMPPFSNILKKQEIADIHKFIQSFSRR